MFYIVRAKARHNFTGFRRSGRFFPNAHWVELQLDEMTPEILAEKMLEVEIVPEDEDVQRKTIEAPKVIGAPKEVLEEAFIIAPVEVVITETEEARADETKPEEITEETEITEAREPRRRKKEQT